MLLGCEKKLREAHNADWSMIVKEIECNGKLYCRTHVNYETSNAIHEPFEQLCERLGATELQPICPVCGKVYHKEASDAMKCNKCKASFTKGGETI